MTKVLPHNVHLNMNKYIAKMASNIIMTKVIYFDDASLSSFYLRRLLAISSYWNVLGMVLFLTGYRLSGSGGGDGTFDPSCINASSDDKFSRWFSSAES